MQHHCFPFRKPTAGRVPRCDQGFFGVGCCITARSGRRWCRRRRRRSPAKLVQWKFSGERYWLSRAEPSRAELTGQRSPPVCGLCDDVMRNLLTCVSVLRLQKMLKFDTRGGKQQRRGREEGRNKQIHSHMCTEEVTQRCVHLLLLQL